MNDKTTDRMALTSGPMLIRPRDAAALLALCQRTLYTMTKAGLLPCVRVGKSLRYDPADLAAWVQRAKAGPLPGPAELEGRKKKIRESA